MRVADESGIVETINGNTSEENPVVKMEDLLVEDGNVTLTIRLIMQGKVSASMPNCDVSEKGWPRERTLTEMERNPRLMSLLLLLIIVMSERASQVVVVGV